MEQPIFSPGTEHKPVHTEAAYYHDQRGVYHDPFTCIVPEYFDGLDERIRREYLEGKKDVSEEIARLEQILPLIKDDPRALDLLASLIDNCAAYSERILRHAIDASNVSEDDPLKFTSALTESDKVRRLKHNALMVDLKAFRSCVFKRHGPQGTIDAHDEDELPSTVLYTGTSDSREAIGYWAIRFADAIAHLPEMKRAELLALIRPVEDQAAQ